jgi:hypothetical protein
MLGAVGVTHEERKETTTYDICHCGSCLRQRFF